MAVCPVNTSQQNKEHDRNVTAEHNLSSDPLEICSDNDVACYLAIRSSEGLWKSSEIVFGSFHQNDGRFSEHSRGYQCTCNALCMLSYAHCGDVDNSMVLDKVVVIYTMSELIRYKTTILTAAISHAKKFLYTAAVHQI